MNLVYPESYKKNNPKILSRIVRDMKENNNFHYLFVGNVGSGKSLLARLIANAYDNISNPFDKFHIIEAREVYYKYLNEINSFRNVGPIITGIEEYMASQRLIFDDIGNEKPGTDSAHEYIGTQIERRYDHIKNNPDKHTQTIITTNLNNKEMWNLYGSRVVDRVQEVFTIMRFKPYSFRKEKREIIDG